MEEGSLLSLLTFCHSFAPVVPSLYCCLPSLLFCHLLNHCHPPKDSAQTPELCCPSWLDLSLGFVLCPLCGSNGTGRAPPQRWGCVCVCSVCLRAQCKRWLKTHNLFMFSIKIFPCLKGSLLDLAFPRCCQAQQSAEKVPPACASRRAAGRRWG